MQKIFVTILSMLLSWSILSPDGITVYLIGDSTMAEKLPEKRPETGWGEPFRQFFDESVTVSNHARNGRSTGSFLRENRWQPIVDSLSEGDYVFIQFGHNDQSKEKGDRYTPPDQYERNLIKFVSETRMRNAHPVLLTPIMRRRFDSTGTFYDVHGVYPDIVRRVATEQRVSLIDLHRMSEKVIKEYGVEKSKQLFLWVEPGTNPNYPDGVQDNTHFTPLGAETWARLVAEEIRALKLGLAQHVQITAKKQY
jgi:lysophospholipase L1-like esterase